MSDSDHIVALFKGIPELNAQYAIEAMGGSESVYEKTLLHMVRQIPTNIDEMDAAIKVKGGLGAFGVKVHGIKSVLRHVGMTVLANDAEALETAAKAGDEKYCVSQYIAFKVQLLRFRDQVNAAVNPEAGAAAGSVPDGNLSDFIYVLNQAAEAADLCDSMAAYELLLPLTKMSFGETADNWVLKATLALDQFKPFEALEYISRLQQKCQKSSSNNKERR